ncbi:MAG: DUF1801 domain-containing protein [Bacteroidetes bacterium]|nr:DUF1801 domain-containing protein [Bacteroidota bacterium]
MQSKAHNVEKYLEEIDESKKTIFKKIRDLVIHNLPEGFYEHMGYGMACYSVPHSVYPNGYHCNPKQPLPFISLAAQKNFIALYHMGLYANPELLEWFTKEYAKASKTKLDMGKSCIRFKKIDDIPLDLIGELLTKVSMKDWIQKYESAFFEKIKIQI